MNLEDALCDKTFKTFKATQLRHFQSSEIPAYRQTLQKLIGQLYAAELEKLNEGTEQWQKVAADLPLDWEFTTDPTLGYRWHVISSVNSRKRLRTVSSAVNANSDSNSNSAASSAIQDAVISSEFYCVVLEAADDSVQYAYRTLVVLKTSASSVQHTLLWFLQDKFGALVDPLTIDSVVLADLVNEYVAAEFSVKAAAISRHDRVVNSGIPSDVPSDVPSVSLNDVAARKEMFAFGKIELGFGVNSRNSSGLRAMMIEVPPGDVLYFYCSSGESVDSLKPFLSSLLPHMQRQTGLRLAVTASEAPQSIPLASVTTEGFVVSTDGKLRLRQNRLAQYADWNADQSLLIPLNLVKRLFDMMGDTAGG